MPQIPPPIFCPADRRFSLLACAILNFEVIGYTIKGGKVDDFKEN